MIRRFQHLALAAVLGATPTAFALDSDATPAAATPAASVVPAAPAPAPIASEQLLALLASDLQTRFNLTGDLQIDFANPWTPPAKQARAWRVAIVEYPSSAGSSMVVRFRMFGDASPAEEATVILRASLWRDAWFAREPLVSGGPLESTLIEPRRVDCFRMRDSIPVDTIDPDLILVRAVQAGSMLTWRDVGHRPLVRKGEIIDVTACTGLLRVTMKGVALQSGALGDIVTVRNPDSLKTIPALVVGDNRVEVRL